jgi:hypothetical protein
MKMAILKEFWHESDSSLFSEFSERINSSNMFQNEA